jgi:hypothetical protein
MSQEIMLLQKYALEQVVCKAIYDLTIGLHSFKFQKQAQNFDSVALLQIQDV